MTRPLAIAGARLLLADAVSPPTTLTVIDGRIAAIGAHAPPRARAIRADGLLLAPGLVDIHGDAFERQVQPRPGVDFRHDLALIDTDAQLLANGITTAFHGVTLSWEPGLRSEAAFRAFVAAWGGLRGQLGAEHRIHLRLETYAMDQWPAAEAAIASGAVHLLAFNDHTAEIARRAADPARAARYADRSKISGAEVLALAQAMLARADEVEPFVARAAHVARDAGLAMASHDDASPEARARWRALGCTICEFPMNAATGLAARAAGEHVVMGCPNVVRGGSHLGWHSAEAMVRAGAADVLASDYYYPAMRHAAFALAAREVCTLPAAWAMVSANAAAAAGLADRGRIAAGLRADLVLLDDSALSGAEVVASIVGGRIAWMSGRGASLLA
ncbi:alpha-D-ribose 1-methylphosphonate 5-triphosphate diphosphatase [Elioraea sp. Yellowstone]|jgi:alpha-D-ribose 1-methylphosphonate 5-triphosphate diphosphatase|uniref:alpha-D-ribose 1-methylphosphonate 5-triphosphate diphosphatase n=1 Tax=Elioraea sp. Yellowstone TaxID=2592070 RepID=UPI001152B15F|nr:alpha-D-ribose 1-methylphosphonate 5-triphosphate diphosphatase [Elioraea sp. Yellowstone]TQF81641.1 alpha-D-ribose 1-methylphosphonate 5-triphosphate diphosphatase [Elioraea sp. Yellowstone]